MNWLRLPLRRLAVLGPQYGANVKAVASSGNRPRYIRITDIDRWGRLRQDSVAEPDADDLREYLLEDGDVLLARSGATVGKSYRYVPSDGICVFAGYLIRFRFNRTIVDPRYVSYFLQTPEYWAWIVSKKRVAAQPNVNGEEYASMTLPVPPLSEQRRIVEILDQADALRRLRVDADAKAERIFLALFIKMFGDPGANPKEWKTVPLSNLADIQGGLQLTPKRAGNPLNIPYLRVANVYRDSLNLAEIKTLSITEEELRRTKLRAGDILVVEGHGNPYEIGRCAVWDGSIDPCVHQNHLIRIRITSEQAMPEFVAAFLNSKSGRQQLLKFGKTTSGLNTISVANVKQVDLFLPPLELQQQLSVAISCQRTIRQTRAAVASRIEHLSKELLTRAFVGELTISWREAHMEQLLEEMNQQSRVLSEGPAPEALV